LSAILDGVPQLRKKCLTIHYTLCLWLFVHLIVFVCAQKALCLIHGSSCLCVYTKTPTSVGSAVNQTEKWKVMSTWRWVSALAVLF